MSERHYNSWINAFTNYMQNSEAPTSYLMWSAISSIAGAMQRKCSLRWGLLTFYPNMYIVLVGPPGGRKGTAMGPLKAIMRDLSLPLAPSCATAPALIKELVAQKQSVTDPYGDNMYHSSMTIMSEELAVFMGDPEMEIKLTDLFDCPDKWEYVIKTAASDFIDNVFVNLLGCITPGLLQQRISYDSVGSGFTSRLIFVVEQGKRFRKAMPSAPPDGDEMLRKLKEDLEKISLLKGRFHFEKPALLAYKRWYEDPEAEDAVKGAKFEGYNSRRAMHLLKLCMIVSASQRDTMKVTVDDFARSLAILEGAETKMPWAFHGVGRSELSALMGDLIRFFQQRTTATYIELLDQFKLDADEEELKKVLSVLKQVGQIKEQADVSGPTKYTWLKKI